MFERFTERGRQVIVLAQDEARALGQSSIGTEHVLLGLLREEEGMAARVLESLNVTVGAVRAEVARIVGRGEGSPARQLPFTPHANKVLELALREALSLGHNYVGTEHILLGLVRQNKGVAARILLDFNTDAEKIRNEITRMLSGPPRKRTAGWSRSDVEPGQLWQSEAGHVFRVVGIIEDPAVVLEDVATEHRDSYVIGSPLFAKFSKLEVRPSP